MHMDTKMAKQTKEMTAFYKTLQSLIENILQQHCNKIEKVRYALHHFGTLSNETDHLGAKNKCGRSSKK